MWQRYDQLLCNWIIINMIFMKGIWNLYYAKKETPSQAFSCKFCEFLHNDGFWDFLQIILQIFEWLLLEFLLLNGLFVNVTKIINLTILRLYPVKLTRISFLMKSRFILSDYCAIRDANWVWFEFDVDCIFLSVCLVGFVRNFLDFLEGTF